MRKAARPFDSGGAPAGEGRAPAQGGHAGGQSGACLRQHSGISGMDRRRGSISGRRGESHVSTYCASKAAIVSLTQSAGLELIKHNIRVNGICPGVVDTNMLRDVNAKMAEQYGVTPAERLKTVESFIPIGHIAKPTDIANCAVFLASNDSSYIVAQNINVNGGSRMD